MQFSTIDDIIDQYEFSKLAQRHKMTQEEYMLLYRLAEGYTLPMLMDYFNCSRVTVHRLKRRVIDKLRALTLENAIFIFAKKEFVGRG